MKRLIILILAMALMAGAFSFAGEFSGETRADVEHDVFAEENLYTVDAGLVYEAGPLKVGADVKINSEDDLDIGLPVIFTFGNLELKAEPGADNLIMDGAEIYVFDGDITYTFGIFKATYGFGYGTDEVLDMSAELTITDPIPGVVFNVKWFDADDVQNDVLGILEAGVTVKY